MDNPALAEAQDRKSRLQQLVKQATEVSTLPTVLPKIMEVVNDPGAGAGDLKAIVECDPPLTSRVLKTVNSAHFGLRTSTSNLQNAISLLGFTTVRNLALTASVSDMFKKDFEIDSYSRLGLWKHMVAVGLCARLIARHVGAARFEDAYLGGLLHDIGIVLFDENDHDSFRKAVERVQPDRELRVCEREVVGFDHAELGAALAKNWQFPDLTIECIRWHHAGDRCGRQSRVIRLITSAVELANFLCQQKGIGSVRVKYKPQLRSTLLGDLNLGRDDIRTLWEDLDKELANAKDLYEV